MNNNGGNENRDITIRTGNYNERIEGNYIQGNYIEGNEGILQKIFEDVRAGGNITVGNIQLIYESGNLSDIPKPTGFPQNIPSSNTDKYIGRAKELQLLHQRLQSRGITALQGMGGLGKTELAIQYCLLHLQLDSYPGGICWLGVAKELDIGSQILNFVRTSLGLQPPKHLELTDAVGWCWNHWCQGDTLIVVDDLKDYRQIKPYLPSQASQFKVLITTRLKLDLGKPLDLRVLSESDALNLLTELVGKEKVNQEPGQAKELCQRLGYLPLGLQLVGRYLWKRKSFLSLSEMLELLKEKGLNHPSLVVDNNDPTWTSDITRGVEAAFELSWSELSKPAQELGCFLSLFALAPIEWWFLKNTVVEEDLEDAIIELENLHLLQGEDTYQLHQLIREFLQAKLNESEYKSNYIESFCAKLIEIGETIPQTFTLEFVNSVKNAIPHLTEVAENHLDAVSDENLCTVFTRLARFYDGQGLYTLAEPWRQQCVEVLKSRVGENHPDYATSLNNLAALYDDQGKYDKAEPLYTQALELRKQLLGENHPDYATSLNNLAGFYCERGKYDKAETLLMQVLELRKQLLGENHPNTATTLFWLGYLYDSQGKYETAEPLYIQVLGLYKQLLGENHPDTRSVQGHLENLRVKQRKVPLQQQQTKEDDSWFGNLMRWFFG